MKKTTNLKALVLSMIMVFGLVMPMAAQNDGFFKNNNEDIYGNRDGDPTAVNVSGGITNQQFGQTVPVGSGLLILAAAGAGYAMARRRRSMRKAGTMLLALAMVITFTQCKKRIENVTPNNQGGHYITLTVDNPSKVGVNENGVVTFEDNDMIIVLSNNEPVGALLYQNGCFSGPLGSGSYIGDLSSPTPNKPLQFMFTGNHMPEDDWTINISDQSDNLAVLSSGASNELYSTDVTEYSALLTNKCALVKFTLAQSTTETVRVKMVNKAQLTIDEVTGEIGFEPTTSKGYVSLKNLGNNKERWAVVLPQSASESNVKVIDGNKIFNTAATVPAVEINDLNTTGVINNGGTPDGYIEVPYFKIENDEDDEIYVEISSGNVQYNADSDTWRFAPNQWDICGAANTNISSTYNGWIDLFGWGTGDNPTETDNYYDHYPDHYTTGPYAHFDDWGDNFDGGWFTPNDDQWLDLFDRTNKSCPATINTDVNNGVTGYILLPDFFAYPAGCAEIYHPVQNDPNNPWDDFTRTEYTSAQWADMEDAGAIFLPCAGSRYPVYDEGNNTVTISYSNYGDAGAYWTSQKVYREDPHIQPEDSNPATADPTHYSANWAYYLHISNVYFPSGCPRYTGLPVRLVKEADFDLDEYIENNY